LGKAVKLQSSYSRLGGTLQRRPRVTHRRDKDRVRWRDSNIVQLSKEFVDPLNSDGVFLVLALDGNSHWVAGNVREQKNVDLARSD